MGSGNDILGEEYRPFEDFTIFDDDDLPTNSDVTLIVTQYRTQAEKLRSDCVVYTSSSHQHVYVVDGTASQMKAAPPTKAGGKSG